MLLSSIASSGCVTRPINIEGGLIDCPRLLPKTLLAGPKATEVPLDGTGTSGGIYDWGQRTEAARLRENRDKLAVNDFFVVCAAENARLLKKPPRHKVLGIF